MKKLLCTLAVAALCWTSSASAQWFLVAKVGSMDVSFENDEVDTAPTNAGFSLGYEFNTLLPGLAAELDITRSVAQGEVNNSDLGVDTQGLYVAYRFRFGQPFYVKARLGLMDAALTGNLAEDEVGETYGLGLGYTYRNFGVELDYTSIDDDVSFASIGVMYSFR